MRKSGASILFLIIAINAAIWIGLTRSESMPSWSGIINGVSFQPYRGDQDPQVGEHPTRSEEHTSELQSQMRNSYAVFCLKKKKKQTITKNKTKSNQHTSKRRN